MFAKVFASVERIAELSSRFVNELDDLVSSWDGETRISQAYICHQYTAYVCAPEIHRCFVNAHAHV